MRTCRRFAAIALVSGGMAFAANAYAWKEVTLNGPGLSQSTTPAERVMTREELRACVIRRDGLNDAVKRLHEEDAAWSAEAAQIKRLKEDVVLQQPVVDEYSPDSVNGYNAMVDEAAKRTAAHNAAMKKLGAQYYEHKRLRASFDRQCGSRYYESDLQAVSAGKP